MKELSKVKFAEYAKVSKQAINGAINRLQIPTLENGNIDADDELCKLYVQKAKINKLKRDAKLERERFDGLGDVETVAGDVGTKREPSNKSPLGGRPTKEEENSEGGNDRRGLELRKLHAQAVGFELKNMMARGELGNIKFIEDLFFTQLSYAINQFLSLPDSIVDDLIASVMADKTGGMNARTEVTNMIKDRINTINTGAKNGWIKNIERIKKDFIVDIEENIDV